MTTTIRHDWTLEQVNELFAMPFNDLLFKAQCVHRENFDPNEVQVSTLLSIKTGACPEDCKYCPQSARYSTGLEKEQLLEVEKVLTRAKEAKEIGSTRFCMGAAWRNPRDRDMPYIIEMIKGVKGLGLETCMTLGMLTKEQAMSLKEAGLDPLSITLHLESTPTIKIDDVLDSMVLFITASRIFEGNHFCLKKSNHLNDDDGKIFI